MTFFEHDFTPSGFASHKNIIGPLLTAPAWKARKTGCSGVS